MYGIKVIIKNILKIDDGNDLKSYITLTGGAGSGKSYTILNMFISITFYFYQTKQPLQPDEYSAGRKGTNCQQFDSGHELFLQMGHRHQNSCKHHCAGFQVSII